MRRLHLHLFPSLIGRRWGYVNLGEEAAPGPVAEHNPLLNPSFCDKWLKEHLHSALGIEFSYGGWLEDRSMIWSGSYMKPGESWHLGIDYNVPAGTSVHMPIEDAVLVSAHNDPDVDLGWGGKLIFKIGDEHAIFGHLSDVSPMKKQIGEKFIRGSEIGVVGNYPNNGNVFPHLHVQVVAGNVDPQAVDGYGKLYEGVENDFPNPECLLDG